MINLATFWKEVEVYYTPAKGQFAPEEYNPSLVENEGEKPELLPVIKSEAYSVLKRNTLLRSIILTLNEQPNKMVEPQHALCDLGGKNSAEYFGIVWHSC
jgi:hypothetical protein